MTDSLRDQLDAIEACMETVKQALIDAAQARSRTTDRLRRLREINGNLAKKNARLRSEAGGMTAHMNAMIKVAKADERKACLEAIAAIDQRMVPITDTHSFMWSGAVQRGLDVAMQAIASRCGEDVE